MSPHYVTPTNKLNIVLGTCSCLSFFWKFMLRIYESESTVPRSTDLLILLNLYSVIYAKIQFERYCRLNIQKSEQLRTEDKIESVCHLSQCP